MSLPTDPPRDVSAASAGSSRPRSGRKTLFRLFAFAAAAASGLILVFLLPVLAHLAWTELRLLLPVWLSRPMAAGCWFIAAAVAAVPLILKPRRLGPWRVSEGAWQRFEGAADRCLCGRWATVGLAVGVGVLLLGWVPHYLTWPWWSDTEYFAVTAQAWDAGILPYRDLYDFNFPGPTYVHWLLGHLFGWGRTEAFQAFDAALLLALGACLAAWSRTRFGTAGPGLGAFLAALIHYLSVDYRLTAQRDWQASLFAVVGILLLGARKGRAALAGSGLLFALALSFRPHTVLFLPAALSALDEHAREPGGSWRATVRAVAWWSSTVALGLFAAAAPVVLAGVAGDFLHWFRLAWYGGRYDQHVKAARDFWGELFEPFGLWQNSAVFAAVFLTAVTSREYRRTAVTWALAMTFVLLYLPLSPYPHSYLVHPSTLVWSVSLALPLAWVWTTPRLVPSVRALFVLAIVLQFRFMTPHYWMPSASLAALQGFFQGGSARERPPGCGSALRSRRAMEERYLAWEDYLDVLEYLRTKTGPQTRVAAFFRSHPFPAVNGPAGRLPAFPSPGGILWLRFAAPELQAPFEAALARPGDVVVVWAPEIRPEPRLKLERLEAVIRRLYRPEARFGSFEVWRRKSDPSPTPMESGPPGPYRR